jgi:hypothetical protein
MNTKFLKATIGLTLIMLLVSACSLIPTLGSRNIISETRTISGYTRVDVSGAGTLEIVQDGSESLIVETDDNVMPYVTSDVRSGTLYLGLDSTQRSFLPSQLHFTLHVKSLDGITTSGSWDVSSASLQTGSLNIVISGSGKVTITTLTADSLDTTVSGSGELNLGGGVVKQQDINISGSGKYLAGDLQSASATVGISGSGNVTIWATASLTARVSGSGDVSYYGNPQVSFNQSGSGNIHSLGTK